MDMLTWPRRNLLRAIRHLALPPAEQAEYLQNLGTVGSDGSGLIDELALEFDDAYHPVSWRYAEVGFSAEAWALVENLNDMLMTLSAWPRRAINEVWSVAALEERGEWKEIRDLAAYILEKVDQ